MRYLVGGLLALVVWILNFVIVLASFVLIIGWVIVEEEGSDSLFKPAMTVTKMVFGETPQRRDR